MQNKLTVSHIAVSETVFSAAQLEPVIPQKLSQ